MPPNVHLWEHGAIERSAALEIDLARLRASHELVVAALGQQWLEVQERRLQQEHINVTDVHPLYSMLTSPSDTSLVTVSELAAYLDAFKTDKRLNDILKDLRSTKFQSTLSELAVAFRWLRAGAEVTLRPEVPAGEADFLASLHGCKYLVEVSAFPQDELSSPRFRIGVIASEVVKKVFRRNCPVSLKARINHYPADLENRFRSLARKACEDFRAQNSKNSTVLSHDFATVEIEAISATTEDNPFRTDEYE